MEHKINIITFPHIVLTTTCIANMDKTVCILPANSMEKFLDLLVMHSTELDADTYIVFPALELYRRYSIMFRCRCKDSEYSKYFDTVAEAIRTAKHFAGAVMLRNLNADASAIVKTIVSANYCKYMSTYTMFRTVEYPDFMLYSAM